MSKTNPKNHSLAAAPKPSEEELNRQRALALLQQRNSMAQGFANCILQATPLEALKAAGAGTIATFAGEIADAMMDVFYPKVKED